MRLAVPFLFVGLAQASDWSPEAIGVHLVSYHSRDRVRLGEQWNDTNPGLYVRLHNGLQAGIYRNSVDRDSVYLAHTLQTSNRRWALTYGVASNYEKVHRLGGGPAPAGLEAKLVCVQHGPGRASCQRIALEKVWIPLLAVSVKIPTPWADVRLSVLPATSKVAPTTLHLSIEKSF